MSTNRSHKHGLSIDTMWDDLKPQVHQVIKNNLLKIIFL